MDLTCIASESRKTANRAGKEGGNRTTREKHTYLAERVRELRIEVLHDGGHLPLELELVALLEVEPGRVDDGEQEAVVLALADLDARRLDGLRALRRAAQEALHDRLLVRGRSGGDVRGVEDEPEK